MIFISAGHYPAKPGAKYERFIEHDEAVIWAQLLVDQLGDDATLVPTGVLKEKVAYINTRTLQGDIAVEIHFNAAVDEDGNNVGRGSETLYYPDSTKGKALAKVCQKVLAEHFAPDRGIKEGWYRMQKKYGPDFFLAKTMCPAVILEPEFVHRHHLIEEHREDAVTDLGIALKDHVNG
jgi:N-acetylmuramoyl-L-alanine amidase